MKLNTVQKCHVVGYLFLIVATLVEIVLFYNLFSISTFGKFVAVVVTSVVFNFAIWFVALKYQTLKEHLEGDEWNH